MDSAFSDELSVVRPLVAALGANAAVLSLHYDDESQPLVLARLGDAER